MPTVQYRDLVCPGEFTDIYLAKRGCRVNFWIVWMLYGMGFANMGDLWACELAQRLGHENQEVSRRFDRFLHHIANFPGCISHELMSLTNKIQTFWYVFILSCHSVISIYSYKVPAPFRDCCKSGFGSPTAAVVHKGRQGPGHKGLVGYWHLSFHPEWGGDVVCRVLWVLGSFAKI